MDGMTFESKHGSVIIYAKTIEQEAISQILSVANSILGQNAHIRIMPDCHAGVGCVIGTTMKITDKVCPNLVGVDIGCGVNLVKTDIDFSKRLDELDAVIRKFVPCGKNIHDKERPWPFGELLCIRNLSDSIRKTAKFSLGTLGGGNHFIEAYDGGYLAVHSGSRNIGYHVAQHYQSLAKISMRQIAKKNTEYVLRNMSPQKRQGYLNAIRASKVHDDMAYLVGDGMKQYLHDAEVMRRFAEDNRAAIVEEIVKRMGGNIIESICSTHNYIDPDDMYLRKGAISARKKQSLVIPLNMRDGILICKGKGNPEWNFSAPHGAGRLYSRSAAKANFSLDEYRKQMEGIYSTCINEGTIDEAPFAYKDYEEIMECIQDSVTVEKRLVPIYNFKASE